MGKVSRLRILLSAMVLLGLVLTPVLPGPVWAEAPPAGGNLYIVTSAADGGAGSLRAAIALAEASPGLDVITFALPAGSVILLSSELTVSGDLLLSGDQDGDPATADITLSGQGITRVLHVFAPASVTLLNLGISEGLAQGYNGFSGAVGSAGSTALAGGAGGNGTRGGTGQGGGIASSGDLYLLSCELTDNVARGGQGGQGGGGGGGGGGTYDFPGGAGGTGGDGGPGGKAIGGAAYSTGRRFTATGGSGAGGGGGAGAGAAAAAAGRIICNRYPLPVRPAAVRPAGPAATGRQTLA